MKLACFFLILSIYVLYCQLSKTVFPFYGKTGKTSERKKKTSMRIPRNYTQK